MKETGKLSGMVSVHGETDMLRERTSHYLRRSVSAESY
jgi:hypothetical protein